MEEALAGITADNDTTGQDIQDAIDAALSNAGIKDVTVTVGDISKMDATTSEDGSISGNITITCGDASDSVSVSKPIAKLPVSDADKITAAKNVVQTALALKFTATNDTTKQDIQTIIDTALTEAGITDVTVTIGYISKMAATASEEGWIGGQIDFECGEERGVISLSTPIPKLPGAGEVVKEEQTDGKAQISTPVGQLADTVLNEDEKQQLADGEDITIVLKVMDASGSISDEDKALAGAALNVGNVAEGFAMGQYLDISLFKIIGSNRSPISETNGKIAVTIFVPESLKSTDSGATRTFAVIRVHNGVVELLNDVDNRADTITIETDRFSTYAVVYKDTSNGGSGNDGGNGSESGGNNSSNNNDNSGSVNDNNSSQNNANDSNINADLNGGNGSGQNGGGINGGSGNDESADDPLQKDDEPITGDDTPLELCATLAMIFGFSNLMCIKKSGFGAMTEETKKELVTGLILWGKKGGKLRRYIALAVIMILAVYYHAIGKKISVVWNESYEG